MSIDPLLALQRGEATLWVQMVGVNQYDHPGLRNLSYASADCSGLAEALREATAAFPSCHFFVYHDILGENPSVSALSSSSVDTPDTPSLSNVIEGIGQMTHQAQPQDTIIFYFSGHGYLEESSGNLYLCFPETDLARLADTALGIKVLLDKMKSSHAARQVLVLDACHSGGVALEHNSQSTGLSDIPPSNQHKNEEFPTQDPSFLPKLQEALERDSNRRVKQDVCYLLSSESDQLSWEIENIKHGAFTYCLIEGLRGRGADEQGRIEVNSLYKYVRNQTRNIVYEQHRTTQTPYLMWRGSRDIVIGLQKLENLIDDEFLSLTDRERQYEREFHKYLAEQYPLVDAESRQTLKILGKRLFLSSKSIAHIEEKVQDEFKDAVDEYKRLVDERLRDKGRVDLEQLRNESYLRRLRISEPILSGIDSALFEQFHRDRTVYHDEYMRALYQYGEDFSSIVNRKLQNLQTGDLKLGDSVVEDVALKAKQSFSQDCITYKEASKTQLHQYGEFNQGKLKRLQRQLQLGDAVVERIHAEVQHEFDQCYALFKAIVHEQYYNAGTLDYAALQQQQQLFLLGDGVVSEIRQSEERRFRAARRNYGQAIAQLLRSGAEIDANRDRQWQIETGLGDRVVHQIKAEESARFQSDYQSCKKAIALELRTHGEVIPDSRIKWQRKWELEPGVTYLIETEEVTKFQADCKTYRQEVTRLLWHQGEIPPNVCSHLKTQLHLGDAVTGPIEGEESGRFHHALSIYTQRVAQAFHRQGELSPALKQEGVDQGFGESILQEVDATEHGLYTQHIRAYERAIAQEFCQYGILRVETRDQLRRNYGGLVPPIADDVDQNAQALFEKNRTIYQGLVARLYNEFGIAEVGALQQHNEYGFSDAMVEAIATEVRQAYEQNQRKYLQAHRNATRHQPVIDPTTRLILENFRCSLDLSERGAKQCVEHYDSQLNHYESAVKDIVRKYDISTREVNSLKDISLRRDDTQQLAQLRQELNLFPEDIDDTENHIVTEYNRALRKYAHDFQQLCAHQTQQGTLDPLQEEELSRWQQEHGLSKIVIQSIRKRIIQAHKSNKQVFSKGAIQEYQRRFVQAMQRQSPLSEGDRQSLNDFRDANNLNVKKTRSLEFQRASQNNILSQRPTQRGFIWLLPGLGIAILCITAVAVSGEKIRLPQFSPHQALEMRSQILPTLKIQEVLSKKVSSWIEKIETALMLIPITSSDESGSGSSGSGSSGSGSSGSGSSGSGSSGSGSSGSGSSGSGSGWPSEPR